MILLQENGAGHTRGGVLTIRKSTGSVTLNGGAATQDVAAFIPAGSLELAYLARVDTAISGAGMATWGVGTDGDTNRYAPNTTAAAVGTTVGPTNYAGDWQIYWVPAADAIRFSANAGQFDAGVVRHEYIYISASALHA